MTYAYERETTCPHCNALQMVMGVSDFYKSDIIDYSVCHNCFEIYAISFFGGMPFDSAISYQKGLINQISDYIDNIMNDEGFACELKSHFSKGIDIRPQFNIVRTILQS